MIRSIITDRTNVEFNDEPDAENQSPPWSFVVAFSVTAFVGAMVLRPFAGVLFLAGTLSVAMRPLVLRLSKLLGHRLRLAALLSTLGLLLVVLVPLAAAATFIGHELQDSLSWARGGLGIGSWHELSLATLPPEIEQRALKALDFLRLDASELQHGLRVAISAVQSNTPHLFSTSLASIGNLIVTLAAFYFFTCDGPALVRVILRLSPLRQLHTRELMQEFRRVSSASLLGMMFGAAMQSLAISLGMLGVGIDHVLFFGILTFFAAFVPIIAAGLVWLPTLAWLLVMHRWSDATLFGVWSFSAILVIDNILRPWVMRGQIMMHGGVTLIAILGGVALFGPVGVLAGPLVMAFLTAFMRIYQRDYLRSSAHKTIIQ